MESMASCIHIKRLISLFGSRCSPLMRQTFRLIWVVGLPLNVNIMLSAPTAVHKWHIDLYQSAKLETARYFLYLLLGQMTADLLLIAGEPVRVSFLKWSREVEKQNININRNRNRMKSVRHRGLTRFLAIAYLWPAVKILLARLARSFVTKLPCRSLNAKSIKPRVFWAACLQLQIYLLWPTWSAPSIIFYCGPRHKLISPAMWNDYAAANAPPAFLLLFFFLNFFPYVLVGERGLRVGRAGGFERKSPAGELIEICPHQHRLIL